MFFGTALLLWQYSRRINKLVLSVLIAIPLAGYAGANIEAFHISQLDPYTQGDGFLIFLSFAAIFSWLSHSFAFFYVARKVPVGSIKIFLNMTAIGFILFSLSYTIDASVGSYPPYAKFFFIVSNFSIYGSFWYLRCRTISIPDIMLRKRIQSLARGDRSLLSSIGTAQMENEVTRVVGNLKTIVDYEETKLKQSSGLHTPMEKVEIESLFRTSNNRN